MLKGGLRAWSSTPSGTVPGDFTTVPCPRVTRVGEIACLEGLTVVYRSSVDLFFYVVGGCQENVVGLGRGGETGSPGDPRGLADTPVLPQLMLSAVLACLLDALGHLLR